MEAWTDNEAQGLHYSVSRIHAFIKQDSYWPKGLFAGHIFHFVVMMFSSCVYYKVYTSLPPSKPIVVKTWSESTEAV